MRAVKKTPFKTMFLIGLAILFLIILAGIILLSKTRKFSSDDFLAPGKDWPSPKKVEDYFVSNLRMTEKDLQMYKGRLEQGDKISFYVTDNSRLEGIAGNLEYYGFVRSKDALLYALGNTRDDTLGKEGSIDVGTNKTIDINAYYEISEDMSAWEIANILLNKPIFFGPQGNYGYIFMP